MRARKSRRLAALVTAAALMGSAATPTGVWAANEQTENTQTENTQTKDTKLSAEVGSTYQLTIPAATTINYGSLSTNLSGALKVSGNVDVGEKVTVTATSNPLRNESHGENLSYTLMSGTAVFTTADWSEEELRRGLEGAGSGKEISLSVAITAEAWAAAKAGSYEGSVTFKAELK